MMASPQFDVISVGNAIVDMVCRCEDAFLAGLGLAKGTMRIVSSPDEMAQLLKHFPRRLEVAGGSASNVTVGVSSFGGRSAFVGSVLDDTFGCIFRHDLRGAGVDTHIRVVHAPEAQTGRSLILITPDGQRTMLTLLGTHTDLDADVIDPHIVRTAKCVFVEGYLLDSPGSREAATKVLATAFKSGCVTALALSDPGCVERNRETFLQLLKSSVGLLIANEAEISRLYQTEDFEVAVARAAKDVKCCVLTRSAKGSIVIADGTAIAVPAVAVPKVVDATGAGDLFAAGLLFGLGRGMSLEQAARLGSFAAAEIISQLSARPQVRLSHSARLRGLM